MTFLPMPEVPGLDADNSLDVDAVDTELVTLVNYPGLAIGDTINVDFRGCAPDGTPSDVISFGTLVDSLDEDGKFPVRIGKAVLTLAKGGWVFYAYERVVDAGTPGETIEPSLRRFFHLSRAGLSVLLLKQSHDGVVALDELDKQDGNLVVPPYLAMTVGDEVTVQWRMLFPGEDDDIGSGTIGYTLTAVDIGRAVMVILPYSTFESAIGLDLEFKYTLTYTGTGASAQSSAQRVSVLQKRVKPTPLLPPASVRGVPPEGSGEVILDPDLLPDGVFVELQPYPGLSTNDALGLYVQDVGVEAHAVPLDLSSVHTGRLAYLLDGQWLRDQRGKTLSLTYQYARPGYDAGSQPLTLRVVTRLSLPMPSVEDAIAADPGEAYDGSIDGWRTLLQGAAVLIPDDLGLPESAKFKAHWKGFTETGSFEEAVESGTRRWPIRSEFIPANLNRVVQVYYSVSLDEGKRWDSSPVYRVFVTDTATIHLPTLQCSPTDCNAGVSLSEVPDEGLRINTGYWRGMALDQQITIKVIGVVEGANKTFVVRNAEKVTAEELAAKDVVVHFGKTDLQQLALYTEFDVFGSVSFDDGQSLKPFQRASFLLKP